MEVKALLSGMDARRVLRNSSYLLCVHAGNYILPLIVVFYLIKVLGIESFGVYAICTAVAAYVQVLVDYGFTYTGTRNVAQHKDDVVFLSRVFWEVLITKLAIAVIVIFVSCLAVNWLSLDMNLYLAAVLSSVFLSLTPVWFYQGLESYRFVTMVNVAGKLLSCIPVLVLVKDSSDLFVVFYSQAFFAALVMICIYFHVFITRLVIVVPLTSLRLGERTREGWHFFSAALASVVITNGGTLMLGAFQSSSVVGVYASVERIAKAVVSIFIPLSHAIYPINSRAFAEDFTHGLKSVARTGSIFLMAGFVVSALLVLSGWFFQRYFDYSPDSQVFFMIFAAWLFVGVLNNLLGIQLLTSAGYSKFYARCFYAAALFFLVLGYFLIKFYAALGAAYSFLAVEIFLTFVLMAVVVRIIKA